MGLGCAKSALAVGLTPCDFGDVVVRGHFLASGGFSAGSASDEDSGRPGQFCNSRRRQIGGELCPHRRHEWLDAHDVHDARKIVGEYVHCS